MHVSGNKQTQNNHCSLSKPESEAVLFVGLGDLVASVSDFLGVADFLVVAAFLGVADFLVVADFGAGDTGGGITGAVGTGHTHTTSWYIGETNCLTTLYKYSCRCLLRPGSLLMAGISSFGGIDLMISMFWRIFNVQNFFTLTPSALNKKCWYDRMPSIFLKNVQRKSVQ